MGQTLYFKDGHYDRKLQHCEHRNEVLNKGTVVLFSSIDVEIEFTTLGLLKGKNTVERKCISNYL